MAYSLAKPRGAADRASPDIHVPLPLEGPGGAATEDARRSERLIGNCRARGHGRVMRVSKGGASDRPTDRRTPPWHHPQRTPGRKPGSGALIEPTIGLRNASQAEYQVPVALSKPSTKFPDQ